MALADIIKRIDRDARAEADALVLAAEQEADTLRRQAQESGQTVLTELVARAEREAAEESRTRLATARLRGRDRILAEKRVLIGRVLDAATEQLIALPDDRYGALLAREVARAARGGERLRPASAEAERLRDVLPAALEAAGADVTLAEPTADIERGVMLEGNRMRVEISPVSLVASDRSRLEEVVSDVLFGSGDGE